MKISICFNLILFLFIKKYEAVDNKIAIITAFVWVCNKIAKNKKIENIETTFQIMFLFFNVIILNGIVKNNIDDNKFLLAIVDAILSNSKFLFHSISINIILS